LVVGDKIVPPPVLPRTGLGDEAIENSMQVLDHSLVWLGHRFEGIPTTVVYVPSPLSVYHVAAEDVSYCLNNAGMSSAAKIDRNSDFIGNLVQKISTNQGLGFLGARPTLRALAATTVIHGPTDWNHLNEAGYRALGSLVATHVTGPLSIKRESR
jgi:hypothetical protein